MVAEAGRARVAPADIAAAWRDIQRLPPPAALATADAGNSRRDARAPAEECRPSSDEPFTADLGGVDDVGVIEFGSLVDDLGAPQTSIVADDEPLDGAASRPSAAQVDAVAADPFHGPEVELVFDPSLDPFEELFQQEERVVQRYVMRGPDDFSGHRHVASREGAAMARKLEACERDPSPAAAPALVSAVQADPDDSDMVVIEEDILDQPSASRKSIFAVRPGDYRSLFARLRRGDR
jgi:hypothetical protein